jgi:nucleoside-diphosphate-sugar epimerase
MGALTILITGAAGHVGRACVARALTGGHRVRALIRGGREPSGHIRLTVMRADLASDDLTAAVQGADAIIHCAAAMTGDDAAMARDTVTATERLVAAAGKASVAHLVLAGSVAVYGLKHQPAGTIISEDTALENDLKNRDAYTRAKLAQEHVVIGGPCPATLLRIGAVWGPGMLWNAHIGVAKGPVLLRLGREGQIPLAHIDRVAVALLSAAEKGPSGANPLNILDTDLPDRLRYLNALQAGGWPKLVLPVNWRLFDMIAARLPDTRRPGLLRQATLHARMAPMGWTGSAAEAALSLPPQPGFERLMADALSAEGTR